MVEEEGGRGGGVYLCYWKGDAKTCGSAKLLKAFLADRLLGGLAVGFRVVFVGSHNVVVLVLVLCCVNEKMGRLG